MTTVLINVTEINGFVNNWEVQNTFYRTGSDVYYIPNFRELNSAPNKYKAYFQRCLSTNEDGYTEHGDADLYYFEFLKRISLEMKIFYNTYGVKRDKLDFSCVQDPIYVRDDLLDRFTRTGGELVVLYNEVYDLVMFGIPPMMVPSDDVCILAIMDETHYYGHIFVYQSNFNDSDGNRLTFVSIYKSTLDQMPNISSVLIEKVQELAIRLRCSKVMTVTIGSAMDVILKTLGYTQGVMTVLEFSNELPSDKDAYYTGRNVFFKDVLRPRTVFPRVRDTQSVVSPVQNNPTRVLNLKALAKKHST